MRFSELFGEVFGQTALSSLQLLEENFSGAFWPGFLTSPPKSYREDAGNGGNGFPSISDTKISNHLQMSYSGGSTFSLDILRLWVLFWSSAWALDLRRSATWTKQEAVFESLLKFSYAFYPHNRHWHTRYNWHLGCSQLPHITQSSLTKSGNRMLMAYVWKTHLS